MYAPEFQTQTQSPQTYPVYTQASAEDFVKPETTHDYSSDDNPLRKSLRVNFTRKVFAITAMQLLVTAFFAHFFINQRWFFKLNSHFPIFVTLSGLTGTVIAAALGLSTTLSRRVPLNYILLTVFTLAQSYCVGFLAGHYTKETVLTAAYLTAAAVIGLALYALASEQEITYFGGLIILFTVGGLALSFFSWMTRFSFLNGLGLAGSIILSGLYLIYDVKLLMGHDRFKLSLDDYIRGAMHLYVDVIRIFTQILQMMKAREQEEEERRRRRRQ